MNRIARLFLLSFLTWIFGSWAEEAATEKPADFSEGFKKFLRLGLPDLANAEYVNLQVNSVRHSYSGSLSLSGNAWLLKEENGKGQFFLNDGQLVEVEKGNREGQVNLGGRTQGSWRAVDVKKDLAKIKTALERKQKSGRRGWSDLDDPTGGRLFLLSVNLFQKGMVEEANTLAGQLFSAFGDSRKVLSLGLSTLANGKYLDAFHAFQRDGDWAKFQGDLEKLLQRFSAGWNQAGAVKRVAEKVATRSRLAEIPVPQGEGLTPEDLALARELAEAREGEMGYFNEFWLFQPKPSFMFMSSVPGTSSSLSRLTQRGEKALPLLLALLGDETLTGVNRQSLPGGHSFFSFHREVEGDQAEFYYANLERPTTRGEIALSLLKALPPRSDEERFQPNENSDPAEEIEALRQWYASIKGKNLAELARSYLKEGGSQQRQMASQYLSQNGTEEDFQSLEAFFLREDQENPVLTSHLVQAYLQKRGEKAQEFQAKYVEMLEKKSAQMDPEEKKGIESVLKTLKRGTGGRTLETLLAQFLEASEEGEGMIHQGFYLALASEPQEKVVDQVLQAALKTENPEKRAILLSLLPMARFSRMKEGENQRAEPIKFSPANLEIWKKLLADERSMESGAMGDFVDEEFDGMSLGGFAAIQLESLMLPLNLENGRGGLLGLMHKLPPDLLRQLMRQRAEARLAGKAEAELPPLPDAATVPEARQKELLESLKAAPVEQLSEAVTKLTSSEYLVWVDALEIDEALRRKFSPQLLRIEKVEISFPLAEAVSKSFQAWTGENLSKEKVEKLLALCQAQVQAGKTILCQVRRANLIQGLRVSIHESAKVGPGFIHVSGSGHSIPAMISGMINQGPAGMAHATWMVTPAADEDEGEETAGFQFGMEGQQEEFWQQVESACKAAEATSGTSFILMFSGSPANEGKKPLPAE